MMLEGVLHPLLEYVAMVYMVLFVQKLERGGQLEALKEAVRRAPYNVSGKFPYQNCYNAFFARRLSLI